MFHLLFKCCNNIQYIIILLDVVYLSLRISFVRLLFLLLWGFRRRLQNGGREKRTWKITRESGGEEEEEEGQINTVGRLISSDGHYLLEDRR